MGQKDHHPQGTERADSMCSCLLCDRGEGMVRLLKRETGNTFLCNLPLSLGMDGPTDTTSPSCSRLLTDIRDPGARTNPDSRDTSTITMLEVDLFPVYLGEKIKKRVSPSFPFPPPPYPVCKTLSQAVQPGLGPRQSLLPLTGDR